MRKNVLVPIGVAALVLGAAACVETVYTEQPAPAPEPVAAPPEPEGQVDVGVFYDALAPYGSWVTVTAYGQVWVPHVAVGWRPYTDGHWVYSDYGWTWVSDYEWGWAPFHYGRWYPDPAYGWVWVPGSVWGPAWVAWRSGRGVIGWAPLPPAVRFEAGAGFSMGGGYANFDAVIAPANWCFVDERYIAAPAIRAVIVPPGRNIAFVDNTRNTTNYTVIDNRIVNNSVNVERVEQVTGHPVPRLHVVASDAPGSAVRGGELRIYRPSLTGRPPRTGTAPARTVEPAQSGDVQVRAVPGTPRIQPPPRNVTAVDLDTRQADEQRQLVERQQAERKVLEQKQARESYAAPPDQVKALERRHQAEQESLAKQHAEQQQALQQRHAQEKKAQKDKKAGGGGQR